jgi:hypothetical protein
MYVLLQDSAILSNSELGNLDCVDHWKVNHEYMYHIASYFILLNDQFMSEAS